MNPSASLKPYEVLVADNFHYMDSSETFKKGSYPNLDTAIATCKQIVEDYLRSAHRPGMTAAELYSSYTSFGDDPYIVGPDTTPGAVPFSAWNYAKQRSEEICARDASNDE
jgi:hypothetical protein